MNWKEALKFTPAKFVSAIIFGIILFFIATLFAFIFTPQPKMFCDPCDCYIYFGFPLHFYSPERICHRGIVGDPARFWLDFLIVDLIIWVSVAYLDISLFYKPKAKNI